VAEQFRNRLAIKSKSSSLKLNNALVNLNKAVDEVKTYRLKTD
jgi:hypothetical protein